MSNGKKQLKLSTSLIAPGSSGGGWRDQAAQPERILDFAFNRVLARTAEEGKLDYIFQPDKYTVSANSPEELRRGINIWPEPLTLLSALAGATSHIGLSATVSTTYHEPFHVARMLATLDHLSGGRASWNVVTSIGDLDAHNFRNDHRPRHEQRHAHSEEFLDVVKALWDSWEDDAIKIDREAGDFADPGKIHALHHEGTWFSVRGPLNVARPIQGHPVIVQAGRSDTFKERSAQGADVVFTALRTLPEAQSFYFDLKQRLAKYGRAESDLLLMPPQSLDDLVHYVIPELQNRGIFHTEYSGNTLREHLGLPRPSNRFVVR